MKTIAIIGWYGTETIGDRGILAGLIYLLSKSNKSFIIRIGSLYPFFTERTVIEDYDFLLKISNGALEKIEIFNSTMIREIQKNIKSSDLLIFGGGPLMDIPYLYMMEYAFKYANKVNVKTAILGCGVGPLCDLNLRKSVLNIVELSDVVVFRDQLSLNEYHNLGGKKECNAIIDPAFFAAVYYKKQLKTENPKEKIVINFRDAHKDSPNDNTEQYRSFFVKLLKSISNFDGSPIILIPMHTFVVGHDDRYFLNEISAEVNSSHISVQNNPLSLEETMGMYHDAKFCIGMRFHSVLLQTILNGNNIILDYTDPNKGKTIGFIKQIKADSYYNEERYLSLLNDSLNDSFVNLISNSNTFILDDMLIDSFQERYVSLINKII